MPKVGDVVADKYEILKLIGEGGMGSVFLASHTLTRKRVALKWMLPDLASNADAVQRFIREAEAAGRIAHPNVVDIYDVGQHQDSYFLVMEYLHGEPLTALLERGPLLPQQAVDILLPCLRGVEAAHRKGVIHRDLKPDNIFLCRNEDGSYLQPKVLDFGISKLSGTDNDVNPRLTRTGAVMGTPYYMSPEQIRGAHNVDGRCDVYAFGVILYEALTGQVPFQAETYSALVLAIVTATPDWPRRSNPNVPAALEQVVMRAMAREPEERYANIRALVEALVTFAGHEKMAAERGDPTQPRNSSRPTAAAHGTAMSTPFATDVHLGGPSPRRRFPYLWAVAGALSVVGGLGWFGAAGGFAGLIDHKGSTVSAGLEAVGDEGAQRPGVAGESQLAGQADLQLDAPQGESEPLNGAGLTSADTLATEDNPTGLPANGSDDMPGTGDGESLVEGAEQVAETAGAHGRGRARAGSRGERDETADTDQQLSGRQRQRRRRQAHRVHQYGSANAGSTGQARQVAGAEPQELEGSGGQSSNPQVEARQPDETAANAGGQPSQLEPSTSPTEAAETETYPVDEPAQGKHRRGRSGSLSVQDF